MNSSKLPPIITSDNETFDPNSFIKVVGYQMEHILTGRILPTCGRHELYSRKKMFEKLHSLCSMGMIEDHELAEWLLVPITEIELEEVSGYVIIN